MTKKTERPESHSIRWQLILPFWSGGILLLVGASFFFADLQTVSWVADGMLCACLLGGVVLALVATFPRFLQQKKQG